MVRLADAIAGFVADALSDDGKQTVGLFKKAQQRGFLIELVK